MNGIELKLENKEWSKQGARYGHWQKNHKMGLTNIFVHPLQLFSVNITSHEKITHKVEMRACDKNHYSCPLSTLQRLIYESAPPAFITLAFDRQLAPPPACPPVTQPKTAFVPGGVHVTRQVQVGSHRAEQRQCSPGDCTDEFSLTGFCTKYKECGFTQLYSIQITFWQLLNFLCQRSCFYFLITNSYPQQEPPFMCSICFKSVGPKGIERQWRLGRPQRNLGKRYADNPDSAKRNYP